MSVGYLTHLKLGVALFPTAFHYALAIFLLDFGTWRFTSAGPGTYLHIHDRI